jgi:hypothetical protein
VGSERRPCLRYWTRNSGCSGGSGRDRGDPSPPPGALSGRTKGRRPPGRAPCIRLNPPSTGGFPPARHGGTVLDRPAEGLGTRAGSHPGRDPGAGAFAAYDGRRGDAPDSVRSRPPRGDLPQGALEASGRNHPGKTGRTVWDRGRCRRGTQEGIHPALRRGDPGYTRAVQTTGQREDVTRGTGESPVRPGPPAVREKEDGVPNGI